MSQSVFIVSGVPCHECGGQITEAADEPVVFFCGECDRDHVWHAACLPNHLILQLAATN